MLQSPQDASAISLRALLPDAEFLGGGDIRATSCCCDSRRCRPGDVFVAIRGTQADGHRFATEAARRGAAAVLAERAIPEVSLPTCVVHDSRAAYGRLCQALAGNPSQRLKVIGVTGTNGKTTTSWLIAGVLESGGFFPGLMGTLGYYDGVDFQPGSLTTPPAPALARWLANMEANGCSHGILEVSSHALSQSRIAGIELDAACLTNIRHDHLDYHGSADNYRGSKARLFEHLSEEGIAVINADDAAAASLIDGMVHPTLTVGIERPAEITATPLEQFASEQTFLLSIGDETAPVRSCLIGQHNVSNCLVAAAVGFAYGLELATIVRGLESVRKIPGRLERIECGQPFAVFVDYAHTPDALARCLTTLRGVTPGRVICVFGAGGDRDLEKRPLMGRAVEEAADVAIVTTDNPRSESPRAIIDNVVEGFRDRLHVRIVVDRAMAIHEALRMAQPGDAVLIAGKGHEDCQIIGERRLAFDDREVARQWLYGQGQWFEPYRAAA